MRHGYSNILGELVVADVLDYGDCEHFQIVCPSCREPVFKRIRDATHFFAHYQESKSLHSECELRVRNLTAIDIEAKAAFARDQRLRFFLNELTTLLRESPNETPALNAFRERMFKTLRGVPEFKRWGRLAWDFLNEPDTDIDDLVRRFAVNVYAGWDDVEWAPKTSFGRDQQIRAAADMMRTLATPLGASAMDKAMNAAWCDLLRIVTDVHTRQHGDTEWAEALLGYMSAVATSPQLAAEAAAFALTLAPERLFAEAQPIGTWADVIFEFLLESLVAVLLSLDYMAALKRRARTAH